MSFHKEEIQNHLQTKFFEFAVTQLVRQHRETFEPLWTVDSWVKFLIWISLNCGLPGEKDSLEQFAESMGSVLTIRMRQIFFERTFEELSVKFLADPAETAVLAIPTHQNILPSNGIILNALKESRLVEHIESNIDSWKFQDGIIAIPWQASNLQR
tara:strand:+ start:962 stop:1429 length:468 start_codon:yes stop_codon:yes gene_type:complete